MSFLLAYLLLSFTPALGVDTLRVVHPDPITEAWRWTAFDKDRGLTGRVNDIYEDRDGAVWFATDAGVQRYDGRTWTTYTIEDGLAGNRTSAIVQTRDGDFWFGTNKGISRFDPSAKTGQRIWTTYSAEDGLARRDLSSQYKIGVLFEAGDGTLWAALFQFEGGAGAPTRVSVDLTVKPGLPSTCPGSRPLP